MDENGEIDAETAEIIANAAAPIDEAIDTNGPGAAIESEVKDLTSVAFVDGQIRTLDGDIADDVFAADAVNYQILLGKIDTLLEGLKLDA
jgi:hypothetical protein